MKICGSRFQFYQHFLITCQLFTSHPSISSKSPFQSQSILIISFQIHSKSIISGVHIFTNTAFCDHFLLAGPVITTLCPLLPIPGHLPPVNRCSSAGQYLSPIWFTVQAIPSTINGISRNTRSAAAAFPGKSAAALLLISRSGAK